MGLRWLPKFLAGALVMILVAEGTARVAVGSADAPVLRWHDFSAQLKSEQMDDLGSADVVIIGTSMAQQDLVPSHFSAALDSASVYNAGLNGGVPMVMEPWLLDHVFPRLQPSTVIWGISPLDLSAVYGEATESAYQQALETRPGPLAALDRWGSRFSTLVSGRAVLRDPTKFKGDEAAVRAAQSVAASDQTAPSGERLNFERELGAARQDEILFRVNPYRLDRRDLAAIARTVSQLEELGVDVVFVELPVPERFVTLMANGSTDLELFQQALAALGDELGVDVLTPQTPLADSDFVDFSHLSAEGAALLSADIAAQLGAR